jgi:hypothetical protein
MPEKEAMSSVEMQSVGNKVNSQPAEISVDVMKIRRRKDMPELHNIFLP